MAQDLSLEWLHAGIALDATQAHELEVRLALDADDFEARAMLLGYASRRQQVEGVESDTFREHLLWCIAHRPRAKLHESPLVDAEDSESLVAAMCEHWQAVLASAPDDTLLLLHAALAFRTAGEFDLARSTFERLERLEPTNPQWPSLVASCFTWRSDDVEHSARALVAIERALALQQPREAYTVEQAAELTLKLHRYEEAREFALELLELARTRDLGWMLGNAQYHGHRILGLIALAHGDVAAAERELLHSARSITELELRRFSPDLDLADALLQLGRTEVVIEFLELCTRFWLPRPLHHWITAIRAGEKPELNKFLGMHFDYEARHAGDSDPPERTSR
jgi:tetratricopeptide (TPR) repeat protein